MAFCDIVPYLNRIQDQDLREKLLKMNSDNDKAYRYYPASINKHHSFEGGYFDHMSQVVVLSCALFDMMSKLKKLDFTIDDVILVSYVHDLDKILRYVKTSDSWKIKKGTMWDHREDFANCDESAKVTQMCATYGIILKDIHLEAISLHHGGFSTKISSVYSYPFGKFPDLATILHSADILSGFVLGYNRISLSN